MPSTGLSGPFSLDLSTIDRVVYRISPGAYALGETRNGTFYVSYVGRSDSDIAGRLKQWVGHYNEFKFEYYPSARAAFDKECHLWHDFGGLDNERHPARPQGTGWTCPRCESPLFQVSW